MRLTLPSFVELVCSPRHQSPLFWRASGPSGSVRDHACHWFASDDAGDFEVLADMLEGAGKSDKAAHVRRLVSKLRFKEAPGRSTPIRGRR